MLLYVECHTYLNTLHLTPQDRPLIVDLLQQKILLFFTLRWRHGGTLQAGIMLLSQRQVSLASDGSCLGPDSVEGG
jgi:hypothetical protein